MVVGKETIMGTPNTVSHCGMDCHRTFSRMTVRDGNNRLLFRQRLDHEDQEKFSRALFRLPPGTPVIIEGTFGWSWMADALQEHLLDPYLANCRKVDKWREARSMAKTNKIDADLLSELWPQEPRWWEVWLAPQEVRDQREWLRYRMGLVQMQTDTKCRIHATLHRHGIITHHSDLFGRSGRLFLQQLIEADEPLRPAARQTLCGHLRLLEQLRLQIAQVTRELRRQVRRDPKAQRWDTLPGIGWVLAYTIQAEIGDIRRFATDKKLARYALLAPVANDSGEETGEAPVGRHVGYMGRRTLKWAFIEAAHAAVRRSPRFRAIFDRRTGGGQRDKNQGYIAVARQLCHIGYACQKKGVDYMEQRPLRPGERIPAAAAADSCPKVGQPDHPMIRPTRRGPRKKPGPSA
jgi:transposase